MKHALLLAALLLFAAAAPAQEVKRELIYGAEMMTRDEREAYRQSLQRAKGEEEAKKVRERHREQMQRRARARGVKLDDTGLLVKDKPAQKQVRERKGLTK